jgi:hypothetical protein
MPSGENLNEMSSKLPLMKKENTSQPDKLPKNDMLFKLPVSNGGNLPPDVAAQLHQIIQKMVEKCEPEMQEMTKLFHSHGIPAASIEMGMGALPPDFKLPVEEKPIILSNDLVEGIYKILNLNYENFRTDILGVLFDKHRNTAVEIGKIMEMARRRDKDSLARELDVLAKKMRS